ncbi:MAG: NAD(P)/FAD-dependent oxidoreductase [Legionellales bacterium]
MTLDVLIIGGGPAGATTALLLAEAGWSVGLVEKKQFPRRKVCGEFISATSLPLLQKLGLDAFYLTHAGPEVRALGLYAADAQLTAAMPKAQSSTANWGRAIGREHLDTALLKRAQAAGAQIWQPSEARHLQRKAGLFSCTVTGDNNSKEISARLVVMANGSWERGIATTEKKAAQPSDLLAFKAHFRQCNLSSELMPLLAFPGGYGGLAHSDDQRVTLSCCIQRAVLQKLRLKQPGVPAAEVVLEYIKTNCHGVGEVLAHAQRVGPWLAAGPIRPGVRSCYKEGLFFVGNSAGEAHPVIAEGISMAMQSAWLLAQTLLLNPQVLLSTDSLDDVGAQYSKQWRQHFVTRIHAATLFAHLAMMPARMVSLLLPVLKKFPVILTLGAKLSGKIQQIVPLSQT